MLKRNKKHKKFLKVHQGNMADLVNFFAVVKNTENEKTPKFD